MAAQRARVRLAAEKLFELIKKKELKIENEVSELHTFHSSFSTLLFKFLILNLCQPTIERLSELKNFASAHQRKRRCDRQEIPTIPCQMSQ